MDLGSWGKVVDFVNKNLTLQPSQKNEFGGIPEIMVQTAISNTKLARLIYKTFDKLVKTSSRSVF